MRPAAASVNADAQVQALLAQCRTDTERRNAVRIWLAVWIVEARQVLPADDLRAMADALLRSGQPQEQR